MFLCLINFISKYSEGQTQPAPHIGGPGPEPAKSGEGPGQPGLAHGQSIPQNSDKFLSALLEVNNCVNPAIQIDLMHSFRAFFSFKYRAFIILSNIYMTFC